MILCLAVLVELRLVTDRHRPMASTADAYHHAVKITFDIQFAVALTFTVVSDSDLHIAT